jgi:hypothetical protein
LFIAVTFSCKNEPNPPVIKNDGKLLTYSEFPIHKSLKGQKVGPVDYFMRPERCVFSENVLIVFDSKNEVLFHVMDDDYKMKDGFGKRGDGPNEYKEMPKTWNHHFMQLGGVFSYFYGQNKICKQYLNEQGVILKDSTTCYELPSIFYNVQKVFVVGNEIMVGNGGMKQGKLYFFNPLTKGDIVITDFYPKTNQDINDEFKMYNFLGYLASDVNKDKIIFVNTYFNQIELYNLNGELIREVRRGESIDDDVAGGGQKHFYYYSVQMTDKYIYALYLGEENKNIVKSALGWLKSKVHIFTLEGHPVAELQLDRLVDDMFVNEGKNQITCISGEEEDRFFVQYELPEKF